MKAPIGPDQLPPLWDAFDGSHLAEVMPDSFGIVTCDAVALGAERLPKDIGVRELDVPIPEAPGEVSAAAIADLRAELEPLADGAHRLVIDDWNNHADEFRSMVVAHRDEGDHEIVAFRLDAAFLAELDRWVSAFASPLLFPFAVGPAPEADTPEMLRKVVALGAFAYEGQGLIWATRPADRYGFNAWTDTDGHRRFELDLAWRGRTVTRQVRLRIAEDRDRVHLEGHDPVWGELGLTVMADAFQSFSVATAEAEADRATELSLGPAQGEEDEEITARFYPHDRGCRVEWWAPDEPVFGLAMNSGEFSAFAAMMAKAADEIATGEGP